MPSVDDLISEMEAAFLSPVVDEDRAASSLMALYEHLSENGLDLTADQGARLEALQAEFRAGPGIFKADLH